MGSHGGADARRASANCSPSYHIDEAHLGVPVKTDMDAANRSATNSLGRAGLVGQERPGGRRRRHRLAGQAAHRLPRHSSRCGIVKMLVIGLGKRDGAAQHHRWGSRGLRDMMPESGKVILDEDAVPRRAGHPGKRQRGDGRSCEVVDRDDLLDVEPACSTRRRELMGRLPFDELDVLVIGEMRQELLGRRDRPERRRPAADRGRPGAGDEQAEDHRACAAWTCRRRATATRTGVGIADLTTDRLLASRSTRRRSG